MPKILYAGSDIGDVVIVSGEPYTTTSASNIDTAVARGGVFIGGGTAVRCDLLEPYTTGTFWFRANAKLRSAGGSPYPLITFGDSTGNFVRMAGVGNSWKMQTNTGTAASPTWTDVGSPQSVGTSPNFIDIKVVLGSPHVVEFYLNNTLRISGTFSNAEFASIDQFLLQPAYYEIVCSEMMVMEDISTLGKRLGVRVPSAAGAYSGWTGTWDDIDEASPDDTNFLTTDTVDTRSSVTLTTAASIVDQDIVGMVVSSRGKISDTSPLQMDHFLRIGGVDYDAGSPSSYNTGFGSHKTVWLNNPATSLPFSPAEVNSATLEVGFKSTP